ncbi:hypothetical protein C9374_007924 [Naegleria lovaniensis]|uniref:Uncharacterized protein n=1 Tax=Naegleria lovaniensis TaxID=51637 RepID=A0AA88KI15_NAELO|nr:uncharacterized protein C9374_007924 [Naegleria lovaniensis]KAG2378776.1 hypothetical protein C9374_007924 [Naegleria lovaniensis]
MFKPNLHHLQRVVSSSTTASTQKRVRLRDYVKSFMSSDGRFRVSLIDSSDSLKSFISRFHLNPHTNPTHHQASQLMGQCISASMLLSSLLKGEERIKLEIYLHSDHPTIHHVVAESIQVGEVRGFISYKENPKDFVDDELHSVFSVSRILMEHSKPVMSSLPLLMQGEDNVDLRRDFQEFFDKSEQIPTACTLVCKPNQAANSTTQEGSSTNSGISQSPPLLSYGVIIQRLPMSEYNNTINANIQSSVIEEQLQDFKRKLRELEDQIVTRQDIHDQLFYKFFVPEDASTVRYKPIDYYCRCSKDKVLEAVSHIGLEELCDMRREIVEGGRETFDSTCEYCNNTYHIDEVDLGMLIVKASDKGSSNQ